MKKNYFILLAIVLMLYTSSWAQPTSYGNLNEGNAGDNGDITNSYFGFFAGHNNSSGGFNTFIGIVSGMNNIDGDDNTFIGASSGLNNTNGSDNTFLGFNSGVSNIDGDDNTFLGSYSGSSNIGGNENTANGASALSSNTLGNKNTANGAYALYSNTIASENTANGYRALYSNTTGSFNVANGSGSLSSNTTGSFNTANGTSALSRNTTANANAAFGYNALFFNTTGGSNTANGYRVLYSNTTGSFNVANGSGSLSSNTTGSSNTANGASALYFNTTGGSNTANGASALYFNTTGSYNTSIGSLSGRSNTTGSSNTFLGYQSGYQSTGSNNTFLGRDSGRNNDGSYNTFMGRYSGNDNNGNYNTSIGYQSGRNNNVNSNTFLGAYSGQLNTTGGENTFIGYQSGKNNTVGSGNTYLGYYSGFDNPGSNNTFIGDQSGRNSSGFNNMFLGYQSGLGSSGINNTFIGYQSGRNNDAHGSTFLGYQSGWNNTTGGNNTYLGFRSGRYNETGFGNVFIGYRAGADEMGSNLLYIDNSNTSSPLIWGDFENDALQFNGNVRLPIVEEDTNADRVLMVSSTDPNSTAVWRNLGDIGGADDLGDHTATENIVPNTDNTHDIGESANAFRDIYFDGSLYIDDNDPGTMNDEFLHARHNNVAIGYNTLQALNPMMDGEGTQNIAIGNGALPDTMTGTENIAIGNGAGAGGDFTNSIAIGNNVTNSAGDQIRLGGFQVQEAMMTPLWTVWSDRRFKINVKEDVSGLDFINSLRPVSYNLDRIKMAEFEGNTNAINSGVSEKTMGFIAQEVEQVVEENNYVFTGVRKPKNEKDHYGLRYTEFIMPLTKAVQELSTMVEMLQQENIALRERVETLEGVSSNNTTTSTATDSNVQTKSAGSTPKGFLLAQNIPNPFNENTTIVTELPQTVREAQLVIYSLNGIQLQSYPLMERGRTSVEIKGGSLQSGMYLYALLADGQLIDTKKMILTK